MGSRAEVIGAGALAYGDLLPGKLDHPAPYTVGEAMGQHLTVRKLVRVAEGRLLYLVDNKSRKWPRRKCWACGFKYSPEMARSCAYCATPLEDLDFLMTQRWAPEGFDPYEQFIKARVRHFGLISPVFAFYRGESMLSVYQYNGESLLMDTPAPLASAYLLSLAVRLSSTLGYLHQRGVVLRTLQSSNVVIMPNGSVRLIDLDVAAVLPQPGAVWNHPDRPAARDAIALASMLSGFCAPGDEALAAFFRDGTHGVYPGPGQLGEAAEQLLEDRQRVEPSRRARPYVAGMSDVGVARAQNEDSFGWRQVGERALLYLVADGLGGHDAGKVASSLAVEAAGDFVVARAAALGKSPTELQATMKAAVEAANQAVFSYRTQHKLEMGTTLSAALLVDGKHLAVGHAGDTRVYRLSGGALTTLTRDQTIAQDLVDDGVLAAEDAPNHRGANILTSTVGGEDEIDVQTGYTAVASGDRVLLCTDGLYRPLGDANVATGLTQWPDRHKTVRGLLRGALRLGSVDNVTAVVADVP